MFGLLYIISNFSTQPIGHRKGTYWPFPMKLDVQRDYQFVR